MDIVLAYSGGLDTSVMIPWLKENYHGKVIAMHTEVGQNDDVCSLKQKAQMCGADGFVSIDLTDELVNEGLLSLAMSGAKYDGCYPLGTSIARSMQAKKQVEVAHKYSCEAVAHGGTAKGNDQIRFEIMYYAIDPSLKIIAPWKEWDLKSRYDELQYAATKGLKIDSKEHRFSEDVNIWNHTYDGDYLEDLSLPVDDSLYKWTNKSTESDDVVKIDFQSGVPISLNNVKMSLTNLIKQLNIIGCKHKIGRTDMVENRITGLKCRSIYEYPGAEILFFAENELRHLVFNRAMNRFIDYSSVLYADLLYDGYFYSRFASVLRNMFKDAMKNATGCIKLRISNGLISVLSRESSYSLYNIDNASYNINKNFNPRSALGYIETIREEFCREYRNEVKLDD